MTLSRTIYVAIAAVLILLALLTIRLHVAAGQPSPQVAAGDPSVVRLTGNWAAFAG